MSADHPCPLHASAGIRALYVHTEYQRRGIASALLQQCCAAADAVQAAMYVEATKEGVPAYQGRAGFVAAAVTGLDLTGCGQEGVTGRYENTLMVREARQ